eukprot:13312302-Ditylum_brightwellii.AAC.1
MGSIPQAERCNRLIYDYTFSGVNPLASLNAPPEAMQFGRTLHRLLCQIVLADPAYGPVFMSKVDLADAYMRVWICLEDVPQLAFIVPRHDSDPKSLVGVHLSVPMEYIESAPFFCATTEMVADLANSSWIHNLRFPESPLPPT